MGDRQSACYFMNLPTGRELNPFDNLDGRNAERHFLGKSLEEAEALFRENSNCYQEDLMFMGAAGFRFYLHAAIRYIESEAAAGDDLMILCFLGILEHRLEFEREELIAIAHPLASACRYILEHCERFDLSPEHYGDLLPRCRALEEALLEMVHG